MAVAGGGRVLLIRKPSLASLLSPRGAARSSRQPGDEEVARKRRTEGRRSGRWRGWRGEDQAPQQQQQPAVSLHLCRLLSPSGSRIVSVRPLLLPCQRISTAVAP